MEPEPPFLPGAGADPSRSEPESAPGPWPSGAGAAQKSGGSATLLLNYNFSNNLGTDSKVFSIRSHVADRSLKF